MKGNRGPGWRRAAGAFALGATAGSTIALLFAPASGRATRKRISRQFRSLGHSTTRQLKQTKRLLAKKAVDLKEAAVEKLGDTREWLLERVSNSNGRHHSAARRVVHHSAKG